MPRSVPELRNASPLLLPEKAVRARAKADLRKTESEPEDEGYRPLIGRAVRRCRQLLGLSLKEFAAKVDRDPRQVARWEDGSERPQLDAIWAHDECRVPLVQGFAEQCEKEAVEICTVIKLKVG